MLIRIAALAAVAVAAAAAPAAWTVLAPEEAGFDAAKLEAWRSNLETHRTSGLLLLRHDRIVKEWYRDGSGPERPHYTASMAKGIVGGLSLLVALDEGSIGPDDPAWKYIPAWRDHPEKSKITIRHLATHSSGIEDAEEGGRPHGELTGWKGAFWRREPDPFTIALGQAPVVDPPGTRFRYSNPGIAALAYAVTASLRAAPQQDIRSLLSQRVMTPLGVPDAEWSIGYGRAYDVDGLRVHAAWGGGSYTARAVARVGLLMLHRGEWEGRQLVGRASVARALTYAGSPLPSRGPDDPAPASALGWWVNSDGVWPDVPRDAFMAAGAGHQLLLVVPSLDLVAVRNGDALEEKPPSFWGPVHRHFLQPLLASVAHRAPYPPSPVVRSAAFVPESAIVCQALDSDNWPMTWGDDDAQYTSYGDGFGFEPRTEKKLSMGFARIVGPADRFAAENLRTPTGERTGDGRAGAKASGIVMVGGVLYMWVRNTGNAQLAWSDDRGRTWRWGFRLETSFGSPAFLNFGRDYAGARDGFVYAYSQDGASAYESDDRLLLARAPKARILEREAWEFFERLDERGAPVWTPVIERRGAVFRNTAGCQRVDAVYNPGIRRYLLAVGYNHQGGWGLYDAPEPWGPWTTVFHTDNWGLGGTHGYRLPAKWISPDGLTMHLVFSGTRVPGRGALYDAFCVRRLALELERRGR